MITIARTPKIRPAALRAVIGTMMDQLDYAPARPEVFLKPNIVDALNPRSAVITDPHVVAGLALALHDRGAEEIVIAENSGYFSSKPANFARLLESSGYARMVEHLARRHDLHVPVVNLEAEPHDEYPWKFGTLRLPAILRTHEYVNVPKMKTHCSTLVTLGMKNQKGLLKLADKKQFHLGYGGKGDLHECIRELAGVVQPAFTVLDATRALEGTGPTSAPGNQTAVRSPKLLVAGRDVVEVDNAACRVMGIPVSEVEHVPAREVVLAEGSAPLAPVDPPFARPKAYVAFGSVRMYTSKWACTNCQMAFSRMFRKISFVPELMDRLHALQAAHPRVDVYVGETSHEMIPPDHSLLVFFGHCTKSIARELDAVHVPGCPPDYNKAIDVLLDLA